MSNRPLGHESTDIMIIFLIRQSVQIFNADNGHVVVVKEKYLDGA
jgi:hypothetical protein